MANLGDGLQVNPTSPKPEEVGRAITGCPHCDLVAPH